MDCRGMIEAITNIKSLAQKACDRLNGVNGGIDFMLMFNSAENLSDYHIEVVEGYDEFKPFKIIDSGLDDERRETLFLLHIDSDVIITIEKDNTIWKVLD
ncbi:hypothetical protein [Bacillus paranthracis]|uniref:hypothetical protein n=1 Tax=Bacillus paranthracis TaxID=2026186 RepID=UPI002D790708|nr:hypothetical protein [Bacillus paranthracis]